MHIFHKKLFILLFILTSLASISQARFFIGIDAGYSMEKVDEIIEPIYGNNNTIITPGRFTKNAFKGNGYLFNLNLGTQHYFDKKEMFGFRWLINIAYGRTDLIYQANKNNHIPSSIINATVGFDFLFDLIKFGNHSLGFFGGVEGGMHTFLSDKFYIDSDGNKFPSFVGGTLLIPLRAGLSLFLAQQHRIEFITKIPVYHKNTANNGEGKPIGVIKPIHFMLGYKFVF